MKKTIFALILGLITAIILAAAAYAEPLPADIQGIIGSDAQIVGEAKPSGDSWFVLTRKGNTHTIYYFRFRNNAWKHSFHAVKSVPQGKNGVAMTIMDYYKDPASGIGHQGPILMLAKYNDSGEYYDQSVFYQLSSSGQWNLVCVLDRKSKADTIEVGKDYVDYYTYDGTNQNHTKVRGTIQRDIRYLSLESFPMNVQDAKNKLTFAPDLPVNSELHATEVQFTGGKKYSVFSGPSQSSIRGGNGKAAVSTNGWIQVFGQENGWILIQYSIDNAHYRFGYIESGSLPKDAYVGSLNFYARNAVVLQNVSVTDDPLYSRSALTSVSQGENVIWLATIGDWAYIEGSNYRGFVPLNAISVSTAEGAAQSSFQVYTAANGTNYSLFEIQKLHFNSNHQVYAVSGDFVRTVDGEEEYYCEHAEGGRIFTYNLAPNFTARMIGNTYEMDAYVETNDLYGWYISAYLDGNAPAGDLTFQCDLPEDQRLDGQYDFWFVTTQIRLNQNNEIEYMEYVYVPWG